MTTPTNKPIPSNDVIDLKFNAEKIDEVVSSNAEKYSDRFGVERYTLEGIRKNISPLGKTYTQEQAVAAISSGEIPEGAFFFEWSDNSNIIAEKYQNIAGVAIRVEGTIISAAGMERLIKSYSEVATSIGKVLYQNLNEGIIDDFNKIPLLGDGSIDPKIIMALYFGTLDITTDISARTLLNFETAARRDVLTDGVQDPERLGSIIANDSVGNVLLSQMYSLPVRAAYGVWGALGQQTIFNGQINANFRAKCAAILAGFPANTRMKILTTGHSWWDYAESQIALRSQLQNKYGGKGRYISFSPTTGHGTPGVTVSVAPSGATMRTLYNCVTADGTGINGQSMYINGAGTATPASISGLNGDRLVLMYQDLNGSFDVTIDDGATTTITGGNTNKFLTRIFDVGSGPHTIKIYLSANTGKVNIFGVEDTTATGSGISVISMAQGGARATNYTAKTIANLADVFPKLNVDMVIITLGTNEVINWDDVYTFYSGLRSYISSWKSTVPSGVMINYVSAAAVNRNLPNYRKYIEAEIAVANEFDIGYMDGYSLMPDRGVMSSNGWYLDTDHPNDAGANVWTGLIINKLLEV